MRKDVGLASFEMQIRLLNRLAGANHGNSFPKTNVPSRQQSEALRLEKNWLWRKRGKR